MTRLILSILALIALAAPPAHGQEIKYTKDGKPYVQSEATLLILVYVAQCGDGLDGAVKSCQDGNAICCQLVASATGS